MAINKNHEFEDLDGVKCAVVEKNASQERVDFIRSLLEYNGYTLVVVPSPPAKVAPAAAVPDAVLAPVGAPSFTVGVTNVMFNVTNAIFGRALHTADGHVVTLAYWQQRETVSHDEQPYYE
jgi:hypothetical protein